MKYFDSTFTMFVAITFPFFALEHSILPITVPYDFNVTNFTFFSHKIMFFSSHALCGLQFSNLRNSAFLGSPIGYAQLHHPSSLLYENNVSPHTRR
ncbi:hypothetical protein Lal_00012598 [Lupinus albus]|nr:hypothetical protein Lal_00012598 [Lupinus albus]